MIRWTHARTDIYMHAPHCTARRRRQESVSGSRAEIPGQAEVAMRRAPRDKVKTARGLGPSIAGLTVT